MEHSEIGKEIVLKGIESIYAWSQREDRQSLESVFAWLSLSPVSIPLEQRFLSLASLSERINYPRGSPESGVPGTQLWKMQIETFRNSHNMSELAQMPTDLLLSILEIFGAFVPAVAYLGGAEVEPDVSLYDYVKLEVAAAVCEKFGNGNNRALLASGDFSGLQKFIYTTSSRGALKTLRARSFFLELLNEHVIYEILNGMLSRANIIFSGGGGFCIVAPATEDMRARLRNVQKAINQWLFDNHSVKLYLGMDWIEIPLDHLFTNDVIDDLSRVQLQLERSKQLKFLDQLKDGTLIQIQSPEQPTNEFACQVCRRDDVPDSKMEKLPSEERSCPLCYRLFHIGEKLPSVRYITRGTDDLGKRRSIPIGKDLFYSVFGPEDKFARSAFDALWIVNGFDVQDYIKMDARPVYIANRATHHGDLPDEVGETENEERKRDGLPFAERDDMATFSGLALGACGADLIGVLRADVDNLGALVTRSLRRSRNYLMRLSALSRSLNYFFKLHLNRICSGEDVEPAPVRIIPEDRKRYVTVVYAGGDDLFIVGAWNHIAELSFDINRAFRRYTCYNPDVTLSAGMTIHDPKFPIYQMARLSESAQEAAKKNKHYCDESCGDIHKCELHASDGKCNRKNSLALFYDPLLHDRARHMEDEFKDKDEPHKIRIRLALKWEEAEDNVLNVVQLLAQAQQSGNLRQLKLEYLPRGFLHKISEMIQMWRRDGKMYLPHMAWVVSRLRDNLWREGKPDLAQEIILQLYLFKELRISSLHIPITWIDLLARGGKQHE